MIYHWISDNCFYANRPPTICISWNELNDLPSSDFRRISRIKDPCAAMHSCNILFVLRNCMPCLLREVVVSSCCLTTRIFYCQLSTIIYAGLYIITSVTHVETDIDWWHMLSVYILTLLSLRSVTFSVCCYNVNVFKSYIIWIYVAALVNVVAVNWHHTNDHIVIIGADDVPLRRRYRPIWTGLL